MAEEFFVDVRYQGLEFGRRVRMEDFASGQAYVHHPLPMPVGSTLDIAVTDDLAMAVRVARVREQVSGIEKPAGMVVKPIELGERQQLWWDKCVVNTEVSVVIVEDLKASDSEQAKSTKAEPPPEISSRGADTVARSGEAEEAQAEQVSATMPADSAKETPKGKKKRRRKRRSTGA